MESDTLLSSEEIHLALQPAAIGSLTMKPDTSPKDALTGAYSRGALDKRLPEEIERAHRYKQTFALLLLDLDHFKSINDAFGHIRGDEVLFEFVQRVLALMRSSDFTFRYGGDEFVLLLPHTNLDQGISFAHRLLDIVQSTPFPGEPPISVSCSIGIASFPEDGATPKALLAVADQRHYQAKRAGRRCVVARDSRQPDSRSLQSPSRLIERDGALKILHRFLQTLPHHQCGLLIVNGPTGAGLSRFLLEVRKSAQLQGYGVLPLQGNPAIKGRVYGALAEAWQVWQGSILPAGEKMRLATLLQQTVVERGYRGLIITLDDPANADGATLGFLQTLFLSPPLPHLALVYATASPHVHTVLSHEIPLREQIELEPLTLTGLRTWLRHSLHWESPEDFLEWLHCETNGLPGRVWDGITYLLEQNILQPYEGSWSYPQNFLEIPLGEEIARHTASPPHNLPTGLTGFVGRIEELQQLKSLIQERRLVTVLGPGGLGKSRLAIQGAAESCTHFPHGVYIVQLTALRSADSLVYAIAEAIQFTFARSDEPTEQLLTHLQTRKMLLVLDSFEHLRDGEPLLNTIVDRAPTVHLLVTSRSRLSLPSAVPFEVNGLLFPQSDVDPSIEDYSAVQLFIRCAWQMDTTFSLAEKDKPFVSRICRLLEGMPLGIELAAAWVRKFSCQEIATAIEHNLAFLATDQTDVPVRHRSLLAMIDSFWHLLSEHEHSVLRQLSVFRGGFREDAARQVAGASPFFLDALVAKGYLRWTQQKRYEIHELLRQYAAEKLQSLPEEEMQACHRHCRCYASFVQQQEVLLRRARDPLERLAADLENIRAAWDWAVAQSCIDELNQMISGMVTFYELRDLFHEGEKTFGIAGEHLRTILLATSEPAPAVQVVLGKLLLGQAHFLNKRARYESAIEIIQSVLNLAHTTPMDELEALAFYELGEARWQQGDYSEAQSQLERAVTLAQATQAHSPEADSLRSLSKVALEQGRYAEAHSYAEQALVVCREIGDRQREGRTLNDLGNVADSQGDYIAGRSYYEQCLHVSRAIGDRPSEGNALANIGAVLADQGYYTESESYYEQGLRIFQESGERRNEAIVLENLGDGARIQGDFAHARTYYEHVLRISQEIGDRQGEGIMLANLGLLAHQSGNNQAAMQACQQAIQIAQGIDDRRGLGSALLYLAHAQAALNRPVEAAESYRQALSLYQTLAQNHLATEALAGLAGIALLQDDLPQALAYVETILEHLATDTLDGTSDPFRVYLTCYRVLKTHQDLRASDILHTAYHLLQERADRIANVERRDMFLKNVPSHRDLVASLRGLQFQNTD